MLYICLKYEIVYASNGEDYPHKLLSQIEKCSLSGVSTVCGASCFTSCNTLPGSSNFYTQDSTWCARRYMTMSISVELSSIDMLHFRHRVGLVKTTHTGNTVLYVPTLFGNCGDLERACGLTILNGVVFSTIPSCENYGLISRWCTIHI